MAAIDIDKKLCAEKLKVLAYPTRISILSCLMQGSKHVGEMNQVIKVNQNLLSHHLRVLRESGFITSQRDGKGIIYSLAKNIVLDADTKILQLGCCSLSFD